MSKCDTALRSLCKQLGPEYRIYCIDLEKCLYRDFRNGFNVEISGVHTTSQKRLATLYLWYGEKMIVKTVHDVARSDISNAVDELLRYTEQLIHDGKDNWDALYEIKHSKPNTTNI